VCAIWLYLSSVILHVFAAVLLAAGTLLGQDSLLL
jgi:tRNA(Phe) wybutosine-synthesizing methylase Tyw3